MAFGGFEVEDFGVFDYTGFEARLAAIETRIRPKLFALAAELVPKLSAGLGWTICAHVDSHARRRVVAPQESRLALAPVRRGYQRHAHFCVGASRHGLYVGLVLKEDAAQAKAAIAQVLERRGAQILLALGESGYVWQGFGAHFADMELGHIGVEDLLSLAERLRAVRSARMQIGTRVPAADPRLADPAVVQELVMDVVDRLAPLYIAA